MTATRRLAAIMAIDVVGYSRLMGEDKAGTARKGALSEGRRVNPKLTVKLMRELDPDFPWMSEGLRKAGLPEE